MSQQSAPWGLIAGLPPSASGLFSAKGVSHNAQEMLTKSSRAESWDVTLIDSLSGCTGCQMIHDDYRIVALDKKVKELKSRVQAIESLSEIIEEVEDIPLEEAKKKIALYLKENDGEKIDYGDLLEALHIPLPTIVAACDELVKEKMIAGIN